MERTDIPTLPMADMMGGEAACQALVKAAQDDPRIWALTADVEKSVGLSDYAKALPERYLNVGIAEQTMVGIAAGLATCGKVPFAVTFAFLASMRACEQVRSNVCYPNLNVKIYATHAGMSIATGGTTHHATEDLAIMRSFANMTVLVPADIHQIAKVIPASVAHEGPVYIRLRRGLMPLVYGEKDDYQIGRANRLREGSDVALMGCGITVSQCLIAAEMLSRDGVDAQVWDMHTLKPIDAAAVEKAGSETRRIVTVEDHNIIGGLGSAVAEVMAERCIAVPLARLGVRDEFVAIGPEADLMARNNTTGPEIAARVLEILDEH